MTSPSTDPLPHFTRHGGHVKNRPLDSFSIGRPEPFIEAFIRDVAEGRPLRILDVGCGRGTLVAWLLREGHDAWGSDVNQAYIDCGNPFLAVHGYGPDRLRLARDNVQPFDQAFDLILSLEVIEHVRDLEGLVNGLARVSRPGTRGLHVFPARWCPIEPHLKAPMVHWLPKGPVRRGAIRMALNLGLAADYFGDMSIGQRAAIYSTFSEQETFYRSRKALGATFARYGQACETRQPTMRKLQMRLPRMPSFFTPTAAFAYSYVGAYYLSTVQC
jgi:SAM-dependent methyltransferase